MRKGIYNAWICIILDIITFILSSVLLIASNNLFVVLSLGALLYLLSWDAYKASEYLIKHYSNN
jgi:hypothetical protein